MMARPSDRALVLRIEPAAQSRPKASIARACEDCGASITRESKTGRCKRCVLAWINRDPEIRARAIASMRERINEPEVKAKQSAGISKARRDRMASDPAYAAKAIERGRWLASLALGNVAQPAGSASRRRAGIKISERALGWCPVPYRAEYRAMIRRKVPMRTARKAILDRIRQEELRKLAVLHASEAADFLRRFTSVLRRADGWWQYGTVLLTPEQLIERAQQKGWQPFEIRRAA